MKRILLIVLFIVITYSGAYSQFRIGIRGGVNTSYFKFAEYVGPDYTVTVPKDATTGFHFGIITQLKIARLFIQPELLFATGRNDIIIKEGTVEELETHKFNKLNIPVIVGFKYKALKLGVGPVGSVLLSSKADLLEDKGLEQNLKAMTYGFQAGVGLDLGKLALDLKYEGSLSKLGDGLEIGGNDVKFDQRANQLIFSVGLFLN